MRVKLKYNFDELMARTFANSYTLEGVPMMENNEIVSADGVQSTIFVQSTEQENAPVIICMPAMGVVASYYTPLLKVLSRRYHAIAADLRGNGKSGVQVRNGANFGYHEMVHYDWPAIVAKARELFPKSPLFLLGHSLGGQLSALYASVNPHSIDGLILVASCSVYYNGWPFPYNLQVLAMTQLARLTAEVFGHFPGHKVGFAGREAKSVMRDWSRNARSGHYQAANSPHDFEATLAKMELPVLSISFRRDRLAPKKAVENLWRKMKAAKITHWHLSAADLGLERISHFSWVKQSEPVIEKIDGWLREVVAKA